MARKLTRKITRRGRQIKLTPAEKIQAAFGITPKRVRNLIDEYRIEQQQKKRQTTNSSETAEVLEETINTPKK